MGEDGQVKGMDKTLWRNSFQTQSAVWHHLSKFKHTDLKHDDEC